MSKLNRTYERLLKGGHSISFRDFVALVEAFGFVHVRTKGSHLSFKHPTCPRLLVLQPVGKDAKRYQVREFLDLAREFELHMEP